MVETQHAASLLSAKCLAGDREVASDATDYFHAPNIFLSITSCPK